jgi:hypothetical protein
MKILNLTLKKKWFDMILSGEKKEEYREFKEYWIKRFGYAYESSGCPEDNGYWNEEMKNLPDAICFTNGYGKHRPSFTIMVDDWRVGRSDHPEWGGDQIKDQFVFILGEILKP